MLQAFLSRFRSLRSSIAILCISLAENKLGEKFSIGPMLGTNCWRDPNLGISLCTFLEAAELLLELPFESLVLGEIFEL